MDTNLSNNAMPMARVYKIRFKIAFADPEMPQPRYHTTIFIQTVEQIDSQVGTTHHVTGDLVTGMHYQARLELGPPEWDEMFFDKLVIGYVDGTQNLKKIEEVLQVLTPPRKQKAYNHQTGKTEQFKPKGGFYQMGEVRPPMVKCTEWVEKQAIPALRAAGILTEV